MGDLELSLDDIIKKKLTKTGPKWGRNNAGNLKKPPRRLSDPIKRTTKNKNSPSNKNVRSPSLKGMRGQGQSAIGDARLKIIQKQRQKMTDAREKLSQIAKKSDARLRLIKLREQKRESIVRGRLPMPVRLPERQILQRTVQPLMSNPAYEDELMDYTNDAAYFTRNYSERPVVDNMYSYPLAAMPNLPNLYRTVENDVNELMNVPPRVIEPEKNIYTWKNPLYVSAAEARDIPIIRACSRIIAGIGRNEDRRESKGASWELDDTPIVITKKVKPMETVGILKRSSSNNVHDGQSIQIIKESPPPTKKGPTKTLSERFCHDGNSSAQKISLLKAKLEASQKNGKNGSPESQGTVGHRIVVSNLVPSVTHEDVKELFEDIGELISSKVVRPGTAEVVYKLHKDAVKAVDVYHNRQLDGQPMKCLLVNNRLNVDKGVKPVVEVDLTAFRKALHKKSTS